MNSRRTRSASGANSDWRAQTIPWHIVRPSSSGSMAMKKPLRTRSKSAVITANVPPQIVSVVRTVCPAAILRMRSVIVWPTTFAG